uniref:protein IQ-DOMAIN 31 isoform X1 n=1 Tax=Ziziphus jujuba TaxID=326968 RepID=A0A6P4AD22_ZIZJJ
MGKSPGKWIKGVLFRKKSAKTNISKGREKVTNEKEVVVTAKAPGADFASVPPVASYPDPITVDRNERNLEFESKEAESASHDGGILLAASQDTEAQGSTPPEVPCDPEQIRKEQAATKAQAAFRGYLARRAFRALNGIIRLQALIRGHLVRRQAVATLCSMLGIVKFQALVRGIRVRHSDVGLEVQKRCSLTMPLGGKLVDSVGVGMSTKMAKLSPNIFIRKLLVPSRTVMPLNVHYESGDPNSVLNWLARWSRSYFWKPAPQPKKIRDLKSQRKQSNGQIVEPQTSRSKRTRRPAIVENVTAQAPSEIDKPKRNFRKVSSQSAPAEPVQENPQYELEKVKRSLRKVHNPVVENCVVSDAETETSKTTGEKTLNTSAHDITTNPPNLPVVETVLEPLAKKELPHPNNANEKMKKETTTSSNIPVVETVPEPLAKKEPPRPNNASEKMKKETNTASKIPLVETVPEPLPKKEPSRPNNASEKMKKETTTASNISLVETVPEPLMKKELPDVSSGNLPPTDSKPPPESNTKDKIISDEQAALELKVVKESTGKEENTSKTNGGLNQKDDLTSSDNQKSSRKSSTPAKQERVENGSGVQSSPTLPSYMAATESAKAKLRLNGSPKIVQDASEKNNVTRRHSLPSSTNSKISSQSPRTQRLVQTGGKGGNKSEKSLSSSRDGNAKVTQAEWRR